MLSAKAFIFIAALAVCYAAPNTQKIFSKHLGLVGGVNATSGQFPFQASIQFCLFEVCEHICGGVIINEYWILTGAACIIEGTTVVVGSLNLHEDSEDTQTVDIADSFGHPDFDQSGIGPNDIGLIKLKTPLTYNTNVQPAKIPTKDQVISGTADVSGYGESTLPDYNQLQGVVDLEIISFEDCNTRIQEIIGNQKSPLDEASNICALGEQGNNCDGDLGGPLTQNGTLIGTVTWLIFPCDLTGAPNVFTNVVNFVDWMFETITQNS